MEVLTKINLVGSGLDKLAPKFHNNFFTHEVRIFNMKYHKFNLYLDSWP